MTTGDELRAIDDELRALVAAFPPPPVDPGDAFSEWGGTYTDARRFRDGVRGRTWDSLPASFLERHHDALVFLGPVAIADYLPAYLVAMLRHERELSRVPSFLLSVLTRGSDGARFDACFARLTADQRAAVAATLRRLERDAEGTSRQRDITTALDSYWRLVTGEGRS